MGCCGSKGTPSLEYEVKTNDGKTETVATLSEVRLKLAAGGGGSYRSVPKATPKK
jgi:hypothetical protein